jgi:hypothetical protein
VGGFKAFNLTARCQFTEIETIYEGDQELLWRRSRMLESAMNFSEQGQGVGGGIKGVHELRS